MACDAPDDVAAGYCCSARPAGDAASTAAKLAFNHKFSALISVIKMPISHSFPPQRCFADARV